MHRIKRASGIIFLLWLWGCASSDSQPALNSDRIRQAFGSYGVDVLYSSNDQRISSLYSDQNGIKVTRTLAVVEFRNPMPATIAAEHRRISNGGSIGEVFRSAGWEIEKHNLFVGSLKTDKRDLPIAALMRIELPDELAVHAYQFVVRQAGRATNYAKITEIHHPAYLDAIQLRYIYGEVLFADRRVDKIHDLVALPETL